MIILDPATRLLLLVIGTVTVIAGLLALAEMSLPLGQRRRRVPLVEVRSGHVDQRPPQARHANPGRPRGARVAGPGPASATPMDGLMVLGRPYLAADRQVEVWACGLCFDGADVVGDECVHCGRKHPRLAAR